MNDCRMEYKQVYLLRTLPGTDSAGKTGTTESFTLCIYIYLLDMGQVRIQMYPLPGTGSAWKTEL